MKNFLPKQYYLIYLNFKTVSFKSKKINRNQQFSVN